MKKQIIISILIMIFSVNILMGITPDYPTVDWTKAGTGMAPVVETTVNVSSVSGLTDALNNRNVDEVTRIVLSAGDYNLGSTTLNLDKNVIISGADPSNPSSTKLLFNVGDGSSSKSCIAVVGTWGSEIQIDQNHPECLNFGSNYLELSDASTIDPENYLSLYVSNYDTWGKDGNANGNTYIGQVVQVSSKSGNRVYLKDGLHLDYRNYPNQNADLNTLNPRIRKMNPAINVGIEDLYIGPSNGSAANGSHIKFSLAAHCWVSNVESNKATYNHVVISNSIHIKVYGSYFHKGNVDYGPGKAYGILISNKGTSCLIENNIFYWLRHGICLAGGANGNVYGYNFSYRTVGDDDPLPGVYAQYTDFAYSDIFLHGHYPFANLIEGNVGHFIYIDQCWGKNGPFNMIYKNTTLNHDESYGLRIDDNNPEQNVIGNYIAFKFSWIAYAAGYPQGYEIYDDNVYEYHNYENGQFWTDIDPFSWDWDIIERIKTWYPSQGSDSEIENSYYLSGRPSFWPEDGTWPYTARGTLEDDLPAKKRWDDKDLETMDYKYVTLRNADLSSQGTINEGYISMHRKTYSTWYDSVISNGEVRILADENIVDVKSEQEKLQEKKHHDWNRINSRYLLRSDDIEFDEENRISAYYTELDPVSITGSIPVNLYLHDSWYVSDQATLEQPDCFREISAGNHEVFLNQYPADGPCYSLRVPNAYATQADIMVFNEWKAYDDQGSSVSTNSEWVYIPEPTGRTTPVVFKKPGVKVEAHYYSANATDKMVTIDEGETVQIPPGGHYVSQFNSGNNKHFGFYVLGTLEINGESDAPVIFESTVDFGWEGIKLYPYYSPRVQMTHCVFKDALKPIYIKEEEGLVVIDIKNCLFENYWIGIYHDFREYNGNSTRIVMDIDNCTFIESNDYEYIYTIYLSDETGGTLTSDIEFRDNIFYQSTIYSYCVGGRYYVNDFFNCTFVYPEEILYHNNNNMFEDPLLDSDYHLQYGSPCIDAGTSNEYDPDGTITDIGAYYYDHIPGTPYLQSITWVNSRPKLTWTPPSDADIQKYLVSKTYTNPSGSNTWIIDVGLVTSWIDNGITFSKFGTTTATYKVKAVDNVDQESAYSISRSVRGIGPFWKPVVEELPDDYALHTAYPNPFNPTTTIQFDIPSETKVLIELYDLLGQKVCTLVQTNYQPGFHSVLWDGKNDNGSPMSAGTYFIKMVTKEYQKLVKCTLIK